MALWSGVMVAYHLQIHSIDIYGDLKILIDGISGKSTLQGTLLSG